MGTLPFYVTQALVTALVAVAVLRVFPALSNRWWGFGAAGGIAGLVGSIAARQIAGA